MKIESLSVSYGKTKVYENFNLEIGDSGVTCLLGESGCGKTTILNAIARLIPYTGEVTPVKVSYVFQTPRLVPNLTVLDNLTLVGVDENKAKDMLERVGLKEKANAYPKTLSGGEQQRVSLCRAFLYPSELLLLDEPSTGVDPESRRIMWKNINNLSKRKNCEYSEKSIRNTLCKKRRNMVLGITERLTFHIKRL